VTDLVCFPDRTRRGSNLQGFLFEGLNIHVGSYEGTLTADMLVTGGSCILC
jgi:hypothetical protein